MVEELWGYLAAHHGVVSRGQAKMLGLTDGRLRRRLRNGEFLRVGPSVFRLAASPDSWEARARAGALSARGLVMATGALAVWGVDGCRREGAIDVLVHNHRRSRIPGVLVHRVAPSEPVDGWLVDGIPVTGVNRSVLDAAGRLPASELAAVIDAVVRQDLTSVTDLRNALTDLGSRGRSGLGVLRRHLDEREPTEPVPDSRFNRLMGGLLVESGLPEPTYEFRVERHGRFVGRADLAYPGAGLLIECDSARWHRSRQAFLVDPRRRNNLVLAGYQVLNFTWDDFRYRPGEVVALVEAALRSVDPVQQRAGIDQRSRGGGG